MWVGSVNKDGLQTKLQQTWPWTFAYNYDYDDDDDDDGHYCLVFHVVDDNDNNVYDYDIHHASSMSDQPPVPRQLGIGQTNLLMRSSISLSASGCETRARELKLHVYRRGRGVTEGTDDGRVGAGSSKRRWSWPLSKPFGFESAAKSTTRGPL